MVFYFRNDTLRRPQGVYGGAEVDDPFLGCAVPFQVRIDVTAMVSHGNSHRNRIIRERKKPVKDESRTSLIASKEGGR